MISVQRCSRLREIETFGKLLALAGSLVLAGCAREADAPTAPSAKEPVRIAVLNHILATPFVAAVIPDENGQTCFDKAGLEPRINKRSRGPEVVDAVISGSVEFGTLAITPQVLQIMQGQDLVAFTTYQTSDLDIKFVARKSAGITAPEQVRGKRLGYVGGTYGEIFLDRYLKKHGLERKDVVLTSGAPAVLRDLFVNGSLDAAILWEPTVQDLVLESPTVAEDLYIDVDRSIYTARVNLVALPESLQKNKSTAQKLARALICAEGYLQKEPTRVQHDLERWMDRRVGSLDGVFHPETFHVTLDVEALQSDLATEAQWANGAVFSGKAQVPSDFGRFIERGVLAEVVAARVR